MRRVLGYSAGLAVLSRVLHLCVPLVLSRLLHIASSIQLLRWDRCVEQVAPPLRPPGVEQTAPPSVEYLVTPLPCSAAPWGPVFSGLFLSLLMVRSSFLMVLFFQSFWFRTRSLCASRAYDNTLAGFCPPQPYDFRQLFASRCSWPAVMMDLLFYPSIVR